MGPSERDPREHGQDASKNNQDDIPCVPHPGRSDRSRAVVGRLAVVRRSRRPGDLPVRTRTPMGYGCDTGLQRARTHRPDFEWIVASRVGSSDQRDGRRRRSVSIRRHESVDRSRHRGTVADQPGRGSVLSDRRHSFSAREARSHVDRRTGYRAHHGTSAGNAASRTHLQRRIQHQHPVRRRASGRCHRVRLHDALAGNALSRPLCGTVRGCVERTRPLATRSHPRTARPPPSSSLE